MIYQALYRKYRPKNFNEVSGQEIIVQTLKNMIINNKITHAYLFIGPRGTGKTSIAKIFAKTINCNNQKNGISCETCDICNLSNNNENIDIIEMDAASNNGVDEIREIRNHITLLPSFSKYKVYIIDEVHMLSQGAFNALLKTLEEPPKHVIFILATTEPQKVPLTIISRCQCYEFKSISKKNMKNKLLEICEKENIKIEDEALDLLIENSNGGMRDAIGMLDQLNSYTNGNIELNSVLLLNNKISKDDINELFKQISNGNIKKCFEISDKFEENNKNYILICEDLIKYLKNIIINSDENHLNLKNNQIINIVFIINKYINEMKNTNDKKIFFDLLIVEIIEKINEKEKISMSYDINLNKNVTNTIEKSKNQPLKPKINYELYDKLMNIRLNNILKDADKISINNYKKYLNNTLKSSYDLDDLKINNLLLDCTIKAGSKNGIIITTSNDNLIYELYDNINIIEKKLFDNFNKNIVICIYNENKWNETSEIYRNKLKNKEIIEYIDEKDILNKIKKATNNSTEFDELIEIGEVN